MIRLADRSGGELVLDDDEEQAAFWEARGYRRVAEAKPKAKAPARKSAAKK